MKTIVVAISLALLAVTGCGKADDGGKSGSTKSSKASKPHLDMSSDSPVCKQAMECCEQAVKAEHGKVTPENLNLSCSGVALATTDKDCKAFASGYAYQFTSKKQPLPDSCK